MPVKPQIIMQNLLFMLRIQQKTRDILNELTPNTLNTKTTTIPNLITPKVNITNTSEISEDFNSLFSNAGQQISDSVI
jgi:hypothetical protein